MNDLWNLVMLNKIAASGIISWSIAQSIKFISTLIVHKQLDFTKLVGSGGMPSSHSALVSAACTSIGLELGIESPEFGMAFIFALIVMYDAAGLRQAVGKQAMVLNKLVKEVYVDKDIKPKRIRELLGHTPIEVFFGGMLGIIIALLI